MALFTRAQNTPLVRLHSTKRRRVVVVIGKDVAAAKLGQLRGRGRERGRVASED